MSLGRIYTIWCDAELTAAGRQPGCPHWVASAPTSKEARTEARLRRWSRGRYGAGRVVVVDVCPVCAPAVREAAARGE